MCIIIARIAAGSWFQVSKFDLSTHIALQPKLALYQSADQKDAYNADNDKA